MLRGFIVLALLLLTLMSCNFNRIYNKHEGIPELVWRRAYVLTFEVDIQDISIPYDIDVAVRHAEGFPNKVLKIKASLTNPSGETLTNPFDLVLADEDGKWIGSGMGQIWDTEVSILDDFRFQEVGTYTFMIEHNMNAEMVPLVMEIGLVVDKVPSADES